MRNFVTGGAGFIGSNLVDRLLSDQNNQVTVYDNLSSGKLEFLADHENDDRFKFVEGDLLDLEKVKESIPGHGFRIIPHTKGFEIRNPVGPGDNGNDASDPA